jgi:hypothetical protein
MNDEIRFSYRTTGWGLVVIIATTAIVWIGLNMVVEIFK